MTDAALIAKRLALIETCVEQLRRQAQPAAIRDDIREQRFVEHTLQIAIQAALDVVEDVLTNHLGDLVAFVAAVRARLG